MNLIATNNQPEEHIIFHYLNKCFTVSKRLYDEIYEIVMDIHHVLSVDEKYTLRQLCGDDCWLALSDGKRRDAGICMAYFVDNKLVPYDAAGENSSNHKVYSPSK